MVLVWATAASVRVILSARAAWVTTNDADMAKNVRTSSIMAKKSRVEMDICYGSGVVVLGPAESV